MSSKPAAPRIVVAGGGVAAVEAILALRALAGPRPAITLLTAEADFSPPAPSVASPFGFGPPPSLPLGPLAARHDVELQLGLLEEVDVIRRLAIPVGADPVPYDHLVVAVGARRRAAVRGALTFRGPGDVAAVEAVLDDIAGGRADRLVVAVPSAGTWPLPAYELAMLAAAELRSRGVAAPRVMVVTPESAPLDVFGPAAAAALVEMLRARGVELRSSLRPTHAADGTLRTAEGEALPADRVIALAEPVGPYVPGLPHDEQGFIPTDAHGRVENASAVYAAGDATTFPVRQGGLAAQQADAAAETIAARLGAIARPRAFRPVLRGVLLTGGAPLYLRAEIGAEAGPIARPLPTRAGSAGPRALWWPPAKVAGRYLAPLLATARPVGLLASPMQDLADAPAAPDDDESGEALALTLALADEDARCGDYGQALHALDAARALAGGVLPDAYADKERDWLTRV